MCKKKSEKGGAPTTKKSAKVSEKDKLSVSAMVQKDDKPKKSSSSRSKATTGPSSSYVPESYFPPLCNYEDEGVSDDDKSGKMGANMRMDKGKNIQGDISLTTNKQQKKLENKKREALEAAVIAKNEALKNDRDAYTVVMGRNTSVLEGEDTADANVKDINIDSVSVSVRGKELLKNASVTISHGRRYGLVGPNGTGKSTLLKLLAWRKIPVPKNIDIHLVDQEVVVDGKTAVEAVVSANEELVKLRKEVKALEELSEDDSDAAEKLSGPDGLYDRLKMMGSDDAEAHASKILAGLGFTKDKQEEKTKSFSGGWRMRISLAGALFVKPSLLLLDEPTNHLDLNAVLWLSEYLCRLKKTTLVVVSHDVDFLNTVCTDIIHLHDQTLHLYRGNFNDFETGYKQRQKEMNKKHEIYEKRVKAAKKSGNQAQLEKLKDMAESAPRKCRDYSVVLDFPEPTGLPHHLLQSFNASYCYDDKFKLSIADVGIDMRTRVAIVGPNGGGKSTLLNLLAGENAAGEAFVPTEGEVIRSQKLRIGRYSQHFVDQLKMDKTAVEFLLCRHSEQEGCSKEEALRAKLGKFGLPGHNHLTPISKLSGGQKARVLLTSISMSRPHILLLDEPTNHLDMQTIDALADALDEFKGGIVLVSHDSRLISRVCKNENSQIWVVEDGTMSFFEGSFEDYKEELNGKIKADVDELNL